MKELFDLPIKKKKRKLFIKTQRWICKRCKHSVHDEIGAYCEKMDLCLEFEEDGTVCTSKDGQSIICDKKEWETK